MDPTRTCPQCQQPLSADAPDGLCPQCLLRAVAGSPPSAAGDGSTCDIIDIADPAEVGKKLPQFEILEMLGRGGMGVVYKARQLRLDRIVALKILPPSDALSADFVTRFTREARALAKLNHPNIVNVHDFGDAGGLYYIVMEYVDGANLRQLMETQKLTPAEALAIVSKICDALQYAHEEGLVHRDIKPENILIDQKGRVKIADFGLAKLLRREALDMTLTLSGMTVGTVRYMAPEQMEKPETVDHRADLYSLGVVIYEMLTGETPMGHFQLPSQKAPVDARLDQIVLHALEHNVDRRYQHASEVRDDVEKVTSSAKVQPDGSGAAGASAAKGSTSDAGALAWYLAVLGATWLGLYIYDRTRPLGHGSPSAADLWALAHSMIPPAILALTARLAAWRRPGPGVWFEPLRGHWRVLLSAHLLIFTLIVFGSEFNENIYYFVSTESSPAYHYEWATDFWIGPFCFLAAVIAAVLMTFSVGGGGGRAFILLAAGWYIGGAVIDFKVNPPITGIVMNDGHTMIRQALGGSTLGLLPASLLMLGAVAMLRLAPEKREPVEETPASGHGAESPPVCGKPRLNGLALLGAIWLSMIVPCVVCVAGQFVRAPLDWMLSLVAGLAPIGATILGWLAISRIKRSNGRLYGLRLAAVEALLLPLLLMLIAAIFLPVGTVLAIGGISPTLRYDRSDLELLGLGLVGALPALAFTFFTGRRAWRAITRRPRGSFATGDAPETEPDSATPA